ATPTATRIHDHPGRPLTLTVLAILSVLLPFLRVAESSKSGNVRSIFLPAARQLMRNNLVRGMEPSPVAEAPPEARLALARDAGNTRDTQTATLTPAQAARRLGVARP